MSKSAYKRLNLTISDVVKVIREQVLDECVEAVRNKGQTALDIADDHVPTASYNYYMTGRGEAYREINEAITDLKNK